ncbi:MAG: phosphotransferase family protein [Xenococcaceae cyanobacterium]
MSYIDDPVFQGIQKIRTPSSVEEVISQAWSNWSGKPPQAVQIKPTLTNYKPFERARIVAEAKVFRENAVEPVKLYLFFHIFANPDVARQEAETGEKRDLLPCQGPPVFLVPDWQTVVWTLPNAPNLTELAQLLNPEKFCQLLVPPADFQPGRDNYPQPKLIRYVPLKRALLTWEHPRTRRRYFAKLCDRADYSRVVGNFGQIDEVRAQGKLGFAVPQLVSYNREYRTLLMTEVSGCQFTEVMRRAFPEPFAEVGRILAQLHGCDLHPETVWTPEKELAVLCRHLGGAKLALPEISSQLDRAIAVLQDLSARLPFSGNSPIHGNLFGDQILYSADGIGIVDWDALSLGDPLYDVGRLIAHLLYLARIEGMPPTTVSASAEALIRAYEEDTGQLVERKCLTWHVASQLLLRGKISSLRKLPEGWQDHMAFVVAESERVLKGKSQYLSLPAIARQIFSKV